MNSLETRTGGTPDRRDRATIAGMLLLAVLLAPGCARKASAPTEMPVEPVARRDIRVVGHGDLRR